MKHFLFLLVLSLPASIFAEGGLPNQPYIYVEGKAEIQKSADIVTLRFSLVATNLDEAKANQQIQAKAARTFAILDAGKVAKDDVIADNLRSEEQYEESEDVRNRGKFIGYKLTRSFSVKVRDVGAFAKLVDEILALGGVEFSGIDAGLSNEKEMQNQVWDKALADARDRAEKALKAAGMKIDSIFAISPVAFSEIQRELFGHARLYAEETGPAKMPNPSQYRLAPITVSQSVHVIYLISPAK
jgi:uncharacterized protein YggE